MTPGPPPAYPPPQKVNTALLVIGWVLAILFPIGGLIVGYMVSQREKVVGGSIGTAIMITSGVMIVLGILLVAASGSSAFAFALL